MSRALPDARGVKIVFRIQEKYIRGAVDDYWQQNRQRLLDNVKAPLVLSGDWRNDSPGYSAQYCTYSFMDNCSKKILALEVSTEYY